MSAAAVARLQREIDALAARLAFPPPSPSPLEAARCAGVEQDPWQPDLLGSDARQIVMLASRQSGKSTITAVMATHRAVSVPGSLVLLLAPALRQSQELFRKVKDVYLALGAAVPADVENRLTLELANGSRIVALPGKEQTIRGFSGVDLLIEDEAARVPDELYQAVRPMLAVSGGQIILLSTPFGKRGFFYQEWAEGGDAWKRVRVTADMCPRIPREWLEAERKSIGDWWFRQEYLTEFVDTLDQVFATDDIMRALDDDVKPLFGE